jgi:hypothetical protein
MARDGRGQPERPGLDLGRPKWGQGDDPFESKRETGWPARRAERFPRGEDSFPRLDEGQPLRQRMSGTWGWVPLIVFALFFAAVFFPPFEETDETTDDELIGFVVLAAIFLGYVAGAIAAFAGRRSGLTWTLWLSVTIFLIYLSWPLTEEDRGSWIVGFLAVTFAAMGLHAASVILSRARPAEDETYPRL